MSRVWTSLQSNKNFIFILAGMLVLFFCLLFSIYQLNKPFYVYLGNDEEQDYLGQAIRMHEEFKPSDFKHPGLLPKTILFWSLEEDNYTVERVQKAFHTAGIMGFAWIAFCLVGFLFLVKPYLSDISAIFFFPFIFICPATFYWLLKYGSNFFSIGMYILLIGLLFRALVFNKDGEFDLHWVMAAVFAFGFGAAIRVTFISFFMLFLLTFFISSLVRRDIKFNIKHASWLEAFPILVLVSYLPINLFRKVVRFREAGVIFGLIILIASFCVVIRKYKPRSLVKLIFYTFIYYIFGFSLGMCGFASSMRKPIFSELNLFSLSHYLQGIKVVFNYAPLLIILLVLGIVSLSFMIIYYSRRSEAINQRRALPLMIFLWFVLTGGTLVNLSHYSVISTNPYPGVPLRLLLHVPFFLAALFTILVPFCKPKFQKLYMAILIFISIVCTKELTEQYYRIVRGIDREKSCVSEINNFLTDKNIDDPILFIEIVNEPANIHYAMRNWGRNAGLSEFHQHYPQIFEVNPEVRKQHIIEEICAQHNIKYVVTDIHTLNKPKFEGIKKALGAFTRMHNFSNGVIILEKNIFRR